MDAAGGRGGQIVTFYSYKGGTGRSMVLANLAYLLARRPGTERRILAIDWDLEAPGLPRYFDKELDGAVRTGPGLIDFFSDVHAYYRDHASEDLPEGMADTDRSEAVFEGAIAKYPLERYLLRLPGLERLDLMPAGRLDDGFATRVRGFDWERFYLQYGSFFTHLRELLMTKYEYVLIDSRTGYTDTSGICTRVMPEKLVAVFAPNRQNIDGVIDVIGRAASYRLDSRDLRGLAVFPLASRLDASASRLRELWWRGGKTEDKENVEGYQPTFEKLFRGIYGLDECDLSEHFASTQIPHDCDYAYGEKIAARQGTTDRLSIGHAVANLMARLTRLDGPWERLPEEEASTAKRKEEEAWRAAEEAGRRLDIQTRSAKQRRKQLVVAGVAALIGLFGFGYQMLKKPAVDPATALVATAQEQKSHGDQKGALISLDEAIRLRPDLADAHFAKVEVLLQLKDVAAAKRALLSVPSGANPRVVDSLRASLEKESGAARPAPPPAPPAITEVPDEKQWGGSLVGRKALAFAIHELGVSAPDASPANEFRGDRIDEYNQANGLKPGKMWATSFVVWCFQQAGSTAIAQPKKLEVLLERTKKWFFFPGVTDPKPGDLVFPKGVDGKPEYAAIVHHAEAGHVFAIAGTWKDGLKAAGRTVPIPVQVPGDVRRVAAVVYEVPGEAYGFARIPDASGPTALKK